ncbi:Re/Si-specific NAD(P)(+) transhydrogenase subunit alpha [Alphaproteobacteria bacterium]|nr:Re/Si-specific NAD(P)(+) transhydrogenase subunit alpha [Alphaproteobacteria bacterium]
MKIFIPKERRPHELRVALSPDAVKKIIEMGCSVYVEESAGDGVSFSDKSFKEAGAHIVKKSASMYKGMQAIFKIQRPLPEELKNYPENIVLISVLNILNNKSDLDFYKKHKISSVALEMVPRITRAQSMDVLSSQSNLAGYRSVIEASSLFDRAFPMMMTAAGTIPPAKVLIIGAGVAGLQAIATARRLGAIVFGYDVRAVAKEQVESLGATFIEVDSSSNAETAGGYAKEVDLDYKRRQEVKLAEVVKDIDIIITTALIPGREAPKLISETMLKTMKPGSVIVDLAVEMGGNCFGSTLGKVTEIHGVKILGPANLPSKIGHNATELYARNILSLFKLIYKEDKKAIVFDQEDEIIQATLLAHKGQILREDLIQGSDPAKKTSKKSSAPKAVLKKPAKKVVKKKASKKETS